jgi:hypothetical protein
MLLPVRAYLAAAIPPNELALEVVPLMVALIVPPTVKSPVTVAEPDTTSEPVINGSNIFIVIWYYLI